MPHSSSICRGRLAPSPTGFLHLGNAWAFTLAWLAARSTGGCIVLRMEDIDPDRSRQEFADAIVDDLRWLGLDWDGAVEVQSTRLHCYAEALQKLTAAGHVYPCYCTRKELRSLAGAPHVDDAGAPYPGICRDVSSEQRAAFEAQGRRPTLRLRCPQADTTPTHTDFTDVVYGPQDLSLTQCGGDFALRRSDGVWAYQLAVVVDDAAMAINQVVRGRDILISTPRQIWLQKLLDLPQPAYAHIPLLLDAEGDRLAKRHHSLSLRALRAANVKPEAVMGLVAYLAKLRADATPLPLDALLENFNISCLAREDIRLSPALLARLYAR